VVAYALHLALINTPCIDGEVFFIVRVIHDCASQQDPTEKISNLWRNERIVATWLH
jgi:hypothetical protein